MWWLSVFGLLHPINSSCYSFEKAPTTWRQTGGGNNNGCPYCGWYESEITCDWCGASESGGEEWGCDYHYWGGMYNSWGGGDPDCSCGTTIKICPYP